MVNARERQAAVTDQAAFSLIELMIVMLVIGILLAIGLPTYLGARHRAADRATQSDMRTGLAAALAYYAETANWDNFTVAQATIEEPHITWVGAVDPVVGQVSIQIHAGQQLLLVGRSRSGSYFCLAQLATSPATAKGRGASLASVDTVAECTGGW